MIPIRDRIPSRTFPYVTIGLIVANVLVYLLQLSQGDNLDAFIDQYALVPSRFTGGGTGIPLAPAAWLPILYSMFFHGGLAHIGGNMLYLWVFGDNVEDVLGHGRYLFFYLACGLVAALTHVFSDPASTTPMVGASGAVAGVLGAYLIVFPRSEILTLIPIVIIPWFVDIPAIFFLGVWFIMQVWSGGMTLHAHAQGDGGVAFMAHVGGFLAGVVLCLLLRKHPPPELPATRPRIQRFMRY